MEKKCILLSGLFLTCLFFSCSSTKKENAPEYDLVEMISIEGVDDGIIEDSKSFVMAEECNEISSAAPERVRERVEFTPPIIVEDEVMTSEDMLDSKSEMSVMAEVSRDKIVVPDSPEGEIKRGGKRRVEQEQVAAKLLTATEINDFKKWDEWGELLDEDFSSYLNIWGIIPRTKFTTKVVDKYGNPAVDAEVWLSNTQGGIEWYARTDNSGIAQLWANAMSESSQSQGNIQRGQKKTVKHRIGIRHLSEVRTIDNARPETLNEIQMGTTSHPSRNVDIFFMVDATGSMGDELHYLQAELNDIIQRVERSQSGLNIRMGSLVYRDQGDDYVVRKSSFDRDISKTVNFLRKQRAGGGGDTPEAVDEALFQCVENETWSRDALARIAFLVLDAPPHSDRKSVQRVQQQVKLAAKKGIRLIPLVASGMEQYGEYLMRSMALSTNGTYVALTDDSGIGNPHAKPTTSFYKVEKLNDLLVRLINEYTRRPLIEK